MDNRPVSIKKPIIAFRQSDLSFKVTYTNLPEMPDVISAQFWIGSIFCLSHDATIVGAEAQFNIPGSLVERLPNQCQVYFLHDGVGKFGGTCSVNMGMAPNPSVMDLEVTISGEQIFVVEVMGLEAVKDQVALATEKVNEAAEHADRAELAKDASLIQAGVYTTEAAGRAAVADGQAFKVQGAGEVAAYEYRRVNAGSSTQIAVYPSKSAVDNHGVTFTNDVEPPSNNFLDPALLQTSVFVNTTGGLTATSPSFSVFTGTWGLNSSFVIGGNSVQLTGFSFAQYASNGSYIAGTYLGTGNVGTDNVVNPQKHASAVTFKLTIRVANVNQLNWGNSILPYDAFFAGATHKVGDKDALGGTAVFEPNLRSAALLAKFATLETLSAALNQENEVAGAFNVIKVKKDGTGDYTNLMAACISITDASPYNRYIIEVYDDHFGRVKADFTTVPSAQTYKAMLYVKSYVKIVGIGGVRTIHGELPNNELLADYTNYETCHMEGDARIDNLRITASRIRYPIH